MRYTIILTPTAKSDIVSLKLSLEQRLYRHKRVIQKELAANLPKNMFIIHFSGTIPYCK